MEIIIYLYYFNIRDFYDNSFLDSIKKYILRDTRFINNPHLAFRKNYFQTSLSNAFNNLYSFNGYNIFEKLVRFFSCRFYLTLIFDIEYFLESPQFSELPSVFNSVTSTEFPTNHRLYFMDFRQLNSTKDTSYFCTPKSLSCQYYWVWH